MINENDKHNHTGQTPSDVPSPKLISPPKKKGSKKITSKAGFNKTAKDPVLGSRNGVR
ncbi:MAG TPA: hypothetical protein VF602_03435 [Pedobacter sp.]|jgi:hypothetical protein